MTTEIQQISINEVADSGVQRYRKGRTLCETIFGRTRYGKDLLTDEWVIIKECKKWNVQEKVSIRGYPVAEDLSQEVNLHQYLQSFSDPESKVVKLVEVCQDPSYIYVITEYCAGGDLFHFLQRSHPKYVRGNKATPSEMENWFLVVRGLFRQLIKGISWMHSKHVCHRDLSLENILITEKGELKIIDLGVAKKYSEDNEEFTTEAGFVGKPGYCAPEVFNKLEYDGRSADLYSCGVVLFVLLTGATPYRTPGNSDLGFRLIMEGRMEEVLRSWKRPVPPQALEVLKAIMRPVGQRVSIEEILRHPYLNESPASSPMQTAHLRNRVSIQKSEVADLTYQPEKKNDPQPNMNWLQRLWNHFVGSPTPEPKSELAACYALT